MEQNLELIENIGMAGIIIYFLFLGLMIASTWKIFTKAGEPGWASIVPIYNMVIMCKIAGKPGWWILLLFIPVVNFIIAIILTFALAKKFGKGVGFGFGLLFLGFISCLSLHSEMPNMKEMKEWILKII